MKLNKEENDKKKYTIAFAGDEKDHNEINSPAVYNAFGVNLKQKNGRIHALSFMYHSDGVAVNATVQEGEQQELLLDRIQEDGYQVIDFKHTLVTERFGYDLKTIILYK